jgi:hypothetical protein
MCDDMSEGLPKTNEENNTIGVFEVFFIKSVQNLRFAYFKLPQGKFFKIPQVAFLDDVHGVLSTLSAGAGLGPGT